EAPRSAPQHEPEGQLLGQRADGELVLLDEDGARLRTAAADARGLSRRDLRVHRGVLQSGAAALVDRLPEPRRVRAQAGEQAVNRTSRRPVETAGAAENAGQRVSRSSLENASRFPQFPQALCDEEMINLVSTESGQGQMRRSSLCRRRAAATSPSPNSTGSRTSSRRSTTTSATSRGPT